MYSVLIAGTVYYWQHRQMTGGGVARFTACDILSLREAGRQAERERETHTQGRTTTSGTRSNTPSPRPAVKLQAKGRNWCRRVAR